MLGTADTTARLHLDSLRPLSLEELAETLDLEALAAQQRRDGTILPAVEGSVDLADHGAALPRLIVRGDSGAAPAELEMRETLGEGGMGRVHLARQLSIGRHVAVKTILSGRPSGRAVLSLLREAWVMGSLEHPSIVPIYGLGLDDQGLPLVVMKHIQGRRWSELLADESATRQLAAGRERLAWHLGVLMRVCDAVQFAHSRSIIHRDLKPDNVMIGEFGEVYVLDWGLAVSLGEGDARLPKARESQGICGTPAYMAPEMLLGRGEGLDTRTDVYLLGAILYEIVTGSPPHRGVSLLELLFQAHLSAPPELGDDVPEELAAICSRALAREVEARYPGVEALRRALAEFLDHRSSQQLTDSAQAGLEELRRTVTELTRAAAEGDGGHDEAAAAGVYRLFGETRFAFREAERVWPENARAREGLDRALTAMAEYEIHCEHPRAAASYLADCRAPPAALTARLEALERRLAQRTVEVERLRAFHQARKLTLSSARRSRGSLISMVFWVGFAVAATALHELGAYTVSVRDFFLLSTVFLCVSSAGLWVLRDKLWTSVANRQLAWSLIVTDVAAAASWGAGWALGAPLHVAAVFTFVTLAGLSALSALNRERQLLPASLGYVLAAVGSALAPQLAYLMVAIGYVALFGYNAWVWRGEAGASRRQVE